MNILQKISADKLSEIATRKQNLSAANLADLAAKAPAPRGFIKSIENKISNNEFAIIAEVKKASPSKGIIRADFEPVQIAKDYSEAGAAGISVLTDEKYFQGSDDFLKNIRKSNPTPLLRKDFVLDEYQIFESRLLGADAILLIVACLDDAQMTHLESVAIENGLDVLVEAHDEAELERALKLKTKLVGINNRDLKTFDISLDVSKRLSKLFPKDRIQVCESGIFNYEHLLEMAEFNYKTFLVGESLMRQTDIPSALKALLGKK